VCAALPAAPILNKCVGTAEKQVVRIQPAILDPTAGYGDMKVQLAGGGGITQSAPQAPPGVLE
jgi:hypothetical protein